MIHYQNILAILPYTFHWFGLFMALSFAATYLAFHSEYKRKEAIGQIFPFQAQSLDHRAWQLTGAITLGFALGFKWAIFQGVWSGRRLSFLFSANGSITGGILGAILLCTGTILYQKFGRKKSSPTFVWVHPYQLIDTILLYCGLFGFLGAILFAKLDSTSGLLAHPLRWLLTYNGLTYYGALIFGALTFVVINRRHGIGVWTALDIGSPGMMLAYAIGRMGCHISGDGDWGIVNLSAPPAWLRWLPDWAWAYQYPHNSLGAGAYIPGCTGEYCTALLAPVYPTSLYESLICFALFGFLWWLRKRLLVPGLMFCIFAILNGLERFLIEFIKVNPRFTFLGLTLSQAQWIALGWVIAGVVGWWVTCANPE